jgi:sporulation protein YlmC with PRC-barrel domain
MSRAILSLCALTVGTWTLVAQPPRPDPTNPRPPANPNPQVNPPNSPPQTPPSTNPLQPSAQPVPTTAGDLHVRRMKQVLGTRVSISGGTGVGTVEDIVFTDQGCIDYLIVSDQGRYVPVPWTAAKFDYDRRTAIVNITPERYREVPVFTGTTYPNFYEPSYMTRVYGYYGIALPERHRRIDRRP